VNNLKTIRKSRHLTQKKLAHMAGVADTSISGYEKGHCQIPIDTAKKLAEVLEVPWTVLYDTNPPCPFGASSATYRDCVSDAQTVGRSN
jgi:transcriptional regulator with XRE-family HTH domain